ncbi:MAG: hypothetical protein ACI9LO_001306 [Planctomycetota bacterium]|jgi:hypothetical protein
MLNPNKFWKLLLLVAALIGESAGLASQSVEIVDQQGSPLAIALVVNPQQKVKSVSVAVATMDQVDFIV